MMRTGTYVGPDFEMVITDAYGIAYCRNRREDILESRLFKRVDHRYVCIGICQSSPTQTEQHKPPRRWRTAFAFNGKTVGQRQTLREDPDADPKAPPAYTHEVDAQIAAYIGSSLRIDGEDRIVVTFDDDAVYTAVRDEAFTDQDLSPELPQVCAHNIGECLRLWNMGVTEEIFKIDGAPTFMGVTINTGRHMYIFEMTPSSIYCRAARFVATNRGVVFNQNFRQGYEAYMIGDNREALEPLSFDESLFASDACVWNSRSVYWSLASYDEAAITLHGCQGDLYHWKKPQR